MTIEQVDNLIIWTFGGIFLCMVAGSILDKVSPANEKTLAKNLGEKYPKIEFILTTIIRSTFVISMLLMAFGILNFLIWMLTSNYVIPLRGDIHILLFLFFGLISMAALLARNLLGVLFIKFNKVNKKSDDKDKISASVIDFYTQVMQEYGKYMESSSLNPLCVSDTDKLPYPKDIIKKSLQLVLLTTKDEAFKVAAKTGYLSLAHYQYGVGDNDICWIAPELKPDNYIEKIATDPDFLNLVNEALEESEKYNLDWRDLSYKELYKFLFESDNILITIASEYSDFSIEKYSLNLELHKKHYEAFQSPVCILDPPRLGNLPTCTTLECENNLIARSVKDHSPCIISRT